MIDPFRHLVGHVSHYCLNMLKMENTKRLTMGREVFDYCGCVLVSSFGIPCACAIQLAINENGGLYLDDIHLFFKSLVIGDGVNASDYASQCDQDVEYLQGLLDELSEVDPAIRRGIAALIRRQLHPEDEGVQEPHVVTSTRGRPPGSTSTRRDPSGFEHAQHEFRDRSRSRSRTRTTTTTRSTRDGDSSAANPSTRTSGDRDSNATRTFEPERFERRADPFPYADNVPDIIIPFIVGWNDVLGDGNCGFRCVADAFNGGEDRWPHARQHLYNEISMKKIYEDVYGGREYVDRARIRIMHTRGPARRAHWMESIADLYAVATLYNCVVMYFTVGESGTLWGCCTILPLTAPVEVTRPCYEFVMVHLGARNQHYIRLFMAPNFPMPPIAVQWFDLRDETVVGWETYYASRNYCTIGGAPKLGACTIGGAPN
ncbi:uncharacterized protein LOC104890756 [Beta vulgaris subsp. vulgaris]|uniref:uncharacterized protein LOC104890756 n=1 Tax=Beta vulgaris subsp. vulgaris TaxID=3555 RepID=UPI002547131E|nr:uncharacterized protein LOC104890756 [Beta vulgaris subsp. vulgaris]